MDCLQFAYRLSLFTWIINVKGLLLSCDSGGIQKSLGSGHSDPGHVMPGVGNRPVHPCDHYECGEAECYLTREGTPACLCIHTKEPPDKNLLCHHEPIHELDSRQEAPSDPCLHHDCGEATCFINHQGQAVCLCPGTNQPPNDQLKCGEPSHELKTRPGAPSDPCLHRDCGEATCFINHEGQAVCLCPGTHHPPNDQLKCGESPGGSDSHPCLHYNCGEAACHLNHEGRPICLCQDLQLPDEQMRCTDPCHNCGEGVCHTTPDGLRACICLSTRKPPDKNGACQEHGINPHRNLTDVGPIDDPCNNYNCGEAACYVNEAGKAACMCIHTGEPPDKNGYCNPCLADICEPNTVATPNLTFHRPDSTPSPSQNVSSFHMGPQPTVNMAFILLPMALGVIVIAAAIAFFLWRRRHAVQIRAAQAQSPITWLHRQESFLLLDHMAVMSKNPGYYTPNLDPALLQSIKDKQISRERLTLLEEIGEGAFGKVYKGEVKWVEGRVEKVAVKVLKEGASRETQDDFKREVEIMSTFDHPNILKLVGVVTHEKSSPLMVFEYMEHGDLAELLRHNDPVVTKAGAGIELKQTDLIDVATQIANGMVYLTSQHFVHRDLAARNCLVGAELHVKISDFGMSRDIYTCDYYRIGGSRMLPVRWMSPESVKYGRFTTESDVWAYGVVLWEIFSFGKQPYYGHTNEEVIRFIEDGILLQRPEDCPSTIYHVMLGCWRSNAKDRFTFDRIHHHLDELSRQVVKCYHQTQLIQEHTHTTV